MRTALILGLIVFAVAAVVWTQQRKLVYFPFGDVPAPEAIGLAGGSPVTFPTSDGLTLNGWYVTRTPEPLFTVIVFNGNAGNRALRAPLADVLARHGLAILLFDYRGFGGNPGSPSETTLKADARAARMHVLARDDVDPRRIVYFGESLGSAVAAELAVAHPPAALILRSPFTSMAEVGQIHYPVLPVRWLLRDKFATVDRIAAVRVPLLVIAGDRDRIVPVDQSRRLYEMASQPKSLLIIAGADHNDDTLLTGRAMIDGILEFLRKL
jgi:fermentation-respiration switch protein FrsA (DUF1100 family)